MRLPSLSTMAEDYLKLMWKASERGGADLATRDIAAVLGVATSTVSGNLRKLDRDGLLEHTPYHGIVLTPLGHDVAVAMVRRHRLIETYLMERLGYTWDEVHAEAESLEHAVSETFLDRIDADLGHPSHDPHGDPIPTRDGEIPAVVGTLLGELAVGASGTVTRVSDDDPALLRYFDELGIALGTPLVVVGDRPSVGLVTVRVGDRVLDLPTSARAALWVGVQAG